MWAGLSPSVSTENDGWFVHLRVMIRCTRVHQPRGYFCTPWRQPWTKLHYRPMLTVDVFFVDGFGRFSYRGLHMLYIGVPPMRTEELFGAIFHFFSLDGILSFLILVGIHEAPGTRTLSFNFLYTILFDFLAV